MPLAVGGEHEAPFGLQLGDAVLRFEVGLAGAAVFRIGLVLEQGDAFGEAEQAQDVFGRGAPTGTCLGVQGQLLDLGRLHGLAQIALDQRREAGFDLGAYPRVERWLKHVMQQPGFVPMRND